MKKCRCTKFHVKSDIPHESAWEPVYAWTDTFDILGANVSFSDFHLRKDSVGNLRRPLYMRPQVSGGTRGMLEQL